MENSTCGRHKKMRKISQKKKKRKKERQEQ